MTQEEYNQITEKFNKEQDRWESLKVGQKVYILFERGELEVYLVIITEINIADRFIIGKDMSLPSEENPLEKGKITKLSFFYTAEELNKFGFDVKD